MVEVTALQAFADVLKLFGNQGGLIIKFRPTASPISAKEPVFALMDGIPVPFFISSLQRRGQDRADVTFETLTRVSPARELIGKTLYLHRPAKKARKAARPAPADPSLLIGFSAYDGDRPLGQVDAYMDWDNNPCLSIQMENRENALLVPFHPEFITEIDGAARCLRLTLPEGFTEIF
jgi:hypothetical protein